MATNIQDLDTAIAQVTQDVAKVRTAVETLIQRLEGDGVYAAEVAELQAAFTSLEQTTAEVEQATPAA